MRAGIRKRSRLRNFSLLVGRSLPGGQAGLEGSRLSTCRQASVERLGIAHFFSLMPIPDSCATANASFLGAASSNPSPIWKTHQALHPLSQPHCQTLRLDNNYGRDPRKAQPPLLAARLGHRDACALRGLVAGLAAHPRGGLRRTRLCAFLADGSGRGRGAPPDDEAA